MSVGQIPTVAPSADMRQVISRLNTLIQRNNDPGDIDVRSFGVVGDGVTDDAPAFQAALDWGNANLNGGCFQVPEPKVRYRCGASLKLYSNQSVLGDNNFNTTFRFDNDTDGFTTADLTASLTTYVTLWGFRVQGVAPTSTSPNITVGINAKNMRSSHIFVISEDFVDCFWLNAGTKGGPFNRLYGSSASQPKYPNTINGYPRYGLLAGGSVSKVSQCVADAGMQLQAQLSNVVELYSGDGTTTTFDLDWTGKIGWYREVGVQVYVLDANSNWSLKVNGVDYDIYALDSSGTPTLIPPGTVNISTVNSRPGFVAYEATKARIVFRAGKVPATGTNNIKGRWNDPTGLANISFQNATGYNLEPVATSGAITAIDAQFGPNRVVSSYCQICGTFANVAAAASESILYAIDYQDGSLMVGHHVLDPAARRVTTLPGGTRGREQIRLSTTQTFNSTSPTTLAWDSSLTVSLVDVPDATTGVTVPKGGIRVRAYSEGWRDIDAIIRCALSSTNTTDSGLLEIEASIDEGATWTFIDAEKIGPAGVSGITYNGSAVFNVTDTQVLPRVGGSLFWVYYRVNASVTDTHATLTVSSGRLGVREAMPA